MRAALEFAIGEDKGDTAVDITAILSGIKGKVLDAQHFDLLKHAYDLQNQNIEQLKSNNEALKEKAQLLSEKATLLLRENEALKTTIKTLESRLASLPKAEELCEDEKKILMFLASCRGEPTAELIAATLKLNLTRTEYYLGRMRSKDYVWSHDFSDGQPSMFYLLQPGKAYLAENGLV